jgi:hypothetical protein
MINGIFAYNVVNQNERLKVRNFMIRNEGTYSCQETLNSNYNSLANVTLTLRGKQIYFD